MKTSIRVFALSLMLALGAAVPVVAAVVPVQPTQSHIVRIADGPTPTPTPGYGPDGGGGCGSSGCPG